MLNHSIYWFCVLIGLSTLIYPNIFYGIVSVNGQYNHHDIWATMVGSTCYYLWYQSIGKPYHILKSQTAFGFRLGFTGFITGIFISALATGHSEKNVLYRPDCILFNFCCTIIMLFSTFDLNDGLQRLKTMIEIKYQ